MRLITARICRPAKWGSMSICAAAIRQGRMSEEVRVGPSSISAQMSALAFRPDLSASPQKLSKVPNAEVAMSAEQCHLANGQIVVGGDHLYFVVPHQGTDNRRGVPQEIRLDLGVGLDGRTQVRPGPLDRRLQRRVEGADLTGNGLAVDAGLNRAATVMTKHYNDRHAEHRGTVFEASDHLGSADVAGDPIDKDVADALVENEFDRHAGVGAGQHGGEWLLLGHSLLFQDDQILVERGEASTYEAGVAVHQLR